MNIEEIFSYFESQPALAKRLGIDKSAITHWRTRGIPPLRAIQIERITGGHFKAVDIVGLKATANDVEDGSGDSDK